MVLCRIASMLYSTSLLNTSNGSEQGTGEGHKLQQSSFGWVTTKPKNDGSWHGPNRLFPMTSWFRSPVFIQTVVHFPVFSVRDCIPPSHCPASKSRRIFTVRFQFSQYLRLLGQHSFIFQATFQGSLDTWCSHARIRLRYPMHRELFKKLEFSDAYCVTAFILKLRSLSPYPLWNMVAYPQPFFRDPHDLRGKFDTFNEQSGPRISNISWNRGSINSGVSWSIVPLKEEEKLNLPMV